MEQIRIRGLVPLVFLAFWPPVFGDEGMWLVNQFPSQAVERKYGFHVTDAFLKKLQLASARFNNGGSGSFISPDGLLFTNHHVGSDCIQKISSAEHDYMSQGFYAGSRAHEKSCPDLEVNVLLHVDDVTSRVNAGVKASMDAAAANRERKAAMARIEKECTASTRNRCDVVTLYSGGRYDRYEYKKYTDIRLVFAPEADIAAFGGDPDNFNYPRYCLDFAIFRAYENGRPAKPKEYFRWSKAGARDGELTFVPGNPGTTGRLMTVDQLRFARDYSYPFILDWIGSEVKATEAFSAKGQENARSARDALLYTQNSFKAYTGFLRGLRDPELMQAKEREEQKLRQAVDADPEKRKEFGSAWDRIAAADRAYGGFFKRYLILERYAISNSDLFDIARHLVRLPEEKAKPNEQRLKEYRDTALAPLDQQLYSTAPISPELETAIIANYLQFLARALGTDDPAVKEALDGKSPEDAAAAYVSTSKLRDVAERKRIAAGGKSEDGMIRLARILDPEARKARKRYEDEVEAVLAQNESLLAQARFATAGTSVYPDATFTFRIAYGPIKGYDDVPWDTKIGGLFERATGQEPYKLPPSWLKTKPQLDLSTPFNFVTTCDTHGGNSGSPTIDTNGEVVGILFDGNLESLPNRFVYTDKVARSVHVASQGILEALRKVYRADALVREIAGK